ncbi:MAG: LysR substrate-binding domain-containing protein [Eubacterium sp.]
MKIEHIKNFLFLADTLNFTLAAKKLFISQSTLTRHIQAMEQELGHKLVRTTSHNVELTEVGARAVAPFRRIVTEYDRFLEQNQNFSQEISGKLRLGLLYYAIDDFCGDFLVYLKEKYPKLQISCHSYQPQQLLNDLKSGKLDFGTLFYSDIRTLEDLSAIRISKSSMVAAVRTDHPLAARGYATLQDLTRYPLVELSNDSYSNNETKKILRSAGVHFNEYRQAEDLEMVPAVIRGSDSLHLTGKHCQRQNAGGVEYLPVRDHHAVFSIGFCYLKSHNTPLMELFQREARQYFSC